MLMTAQKKDPIDWSFRTFLQNRYSTVPKSDIEKVLDNVLELAKLSRDKDRSVKSILEKAASMIFRLFDFGEIAIGLLDPRDGLFRYTKNVELAFRNQKYTMEDMVSYDKYPFVKIGRISELDPVEGFSEDERHMYDRPHAVDSPRASPEDFQEADYIDVWMYDRGGGLIGWFELSRPKNGKMPPCETVRWIEVFAEVCAMIVERKLKDDKAKK
jgi:hypothetical protein